MLLALFSMAVCVLAPNLTGCRPSLGGLPATTALLPPLSVRQIDRYGASGFRCAFHASMGQPIDLEASPNHHRDADLDLKILTIRTTNESPPDEASGAEDPNMMTLGDNTNYFKGPWTGYMNPFKGNHAHQSRMRIQPSTFPAATEISWDWPGLYGNDQVLAYLHIAHGNYNSTFPPIKIEPAQISKISRLDMSYDLLSTGDPSGHNVIIDYFLSREAGNQKTQAFEVDIGLHASKHFRAYASAMTDVGIFVSGEESWKVSIDLSQPAPVIYVWPVTIEDKLKGKLDLVELHRFLLNHIKRYSFDERLYYNGTSLGVEVISGSGSLYIKSLSVNYEP